MDLAPQFLDAGAVVIDLSGAFRLRTAERYKHWYKEEHTAPALLAEAAYGLPEYCREPIRKARLISNPGCYPTAANLAIRPLVEAGIVDRNAGIVCDAKSGVSGAGRKAVAQDQLLRSDRKFLRLFDPAAPARARSAADQRARRARVQLHGAADADRPGHSRNHLFPPGAAAFRRRDRRDLREAIRAMSRSSGSMSPAMCRICMRWRARTSAISALSRIRQAGRCVVVSAIDNLVKGAAGQAIQNLNLALGFDETAGTALKALIKIGGSLLDDPALAQRYCAADRAVAESGVSVTVVHGGGKQMTRFLEERGIKSRFVGGLRVTTEETIDAVLKVLAGTVNTQLVAALGAAGAKAVGLTGIDAGLAMAEQLDPELGFVGRVTIPILGCSMRWRMRASCPSSPAWPADIRAKSST